MKRIGFPLAALLALASVFAFVALASGRFDKNEDGIFGGRLPAGYRDWALISVAHEDGKLNDLRAILGNRIAMKAYREGRHQSQRFRTLSCCLRCGGVFFAIGKRVSSSAYCSMQRCCCQPSVGERHRVWSRARPRPISLVFPARAYRTTQNAVLGAPSFAHGQINT